MLNIYACIYMLICVYIYIYMLKKLQSEGLGGKGKYKHETKYPSTIALVMKNVFSELPCARHCSILEHISVNMWLLSSVVLYKLANTHSSLNFPKYKSEQLEPCAAC